MGRNIRVTSSIDFHGHSLAVFADERGKFGAIGGQSPAYFVCLAASLGYDITIEEPTQFLCDDSVCVGTDTYEGWFCCDDGECVGEEVSEQGFAIGISAIGGPDPIGGPGSGGVVWADPDPSDLTTCLEYFIEGSDPDADDNENQVSDQTVWKYWIVHVTALGDTWFYCDDGECDGDPIEGFLPATDLECEFRRLCPPHTQLVFNYSALPFIPTLDFTNTLNANLIVFL